MRPFRLIAAFLVALAVALPASAQRSGQALGVFDGVGMDEQLGGRLPLDLAFRDETGATVRLADYFEADRPVVLNLVYHNCPMLCNLMLDGFTRSLQGVAWAPGTTYEVVTVSFAADEGPDLAARQKDRYVELLGKPAAADGWHFLTGDEAEIQALAAAVGFQFRWMEEQGEYAHPAVTTFLTPDGRIARYLYGIHPTPRDVRTAIVEAGEGTVGGLVDQVVLFCFQYDPAEGSYVPHAINIMKIGGLLTMLLLGVTLGVFWRREARAVRGELALHDPSLHDAALQRR